MKPQLPALIDRACAQAATEARAHGTNGNFAPMADHCGDPRWGRITGTFGESPHAATGRGFQGAPALAPGASRMFPFVIEPARHLAYPDAHGRPVPEPGEILLSAAGRRASRRAQTSPRPA